MFPEKMVIGSSKGGGFCLGVVWKLAMSYVVCAVGGVFFSVVRFNGLDILVSRLGECEWSWLVAGGSVRARVAGAERRTVTS